MARQVFVSYRHTQAGFVRQRLVPVLEAGGAEVLLDQERFRAGEGVVVQMDDVQDQAQATVVALSSQYHNLAAQEGRRATKRAAQRRRLRSLG